MKEEIKSDKHGNVSVDQFKDFMLSHFKSEMVNKKLQKKDLEGFLSSFIYNAYGSTDMGSIAPTIFREDNYIDKKLNNRVRGNPPPPEVNSDLEQQEVRED